VSHNGISYALVADERRGKRLAQERRPILQERQIGRASNGDDGGANDSEDSYAKTLASAFQKHFSKLTTCRTKTNPTTAATRQSDATGVFAQSRNQSR
jgi:hypothetical protein